MTTTASMRTPAAHRHHPESPGTGVRFSPVSWISRVRVRRWARRMLAPGRAVIVDVETTGFDGAVVEIAVLDAATGAVLLDTLVDPDGAPMEPGAAAVHGITAADLVGAPSWSRVLPLLLSVTRGRIVLAYNADFDRGRILAATARIGADPQHLAAPGGWECVMRARTLAAGTGRHLPLGGGHRAVGDCDATREVLAAMALPGGGVW